MNHILTIPAEQAAAAAATWRLLRGTARVEQALTIVSGPSRCPSCFGGVANLGEGRRILASPDYEEREDFFAASLAAPAWWHA